MNIKIKKFLLITLPFLLLSCSNIVESTNISSFSKNTDNIVHNLNGNTKAKIFIRLSNLPFKTKSSLSGNPNGTVSSISSYQIALCTDANAPVSSVLSGSSFSFNKDLLVTSDLDTSIVAFQNVPSGTYYATVSAFDSLNANISDTVYYSTDGNKQMAVSSNSIEITASGEVIPANETLNITLKLRDAKGATLDSSITVQDGSNGVFE